MQHQRKTEFTELRVGEQRRAPPFDHVADQRRVGQRHGNRLELAPRFGSFDKEQIRSGTRIRAGTTQGRIETQNRARIGTCDHEQVTRSARRAGGTDLSHHLTLRNQPLARQVTAALRRCLIFQLDR